MANLVKISLSHRLRVKVYVETGKIIQNFIEGEVNINTNHLDVLKSVEPMKWNCVDLYDFSGNITSFYAKEWGISHFNFWAETLDISLAFDELISNLTNFQKECKFVIEKTKLEKIKSANREKYLNNYPEAIKIEGYNPTYFDSETIDYIERVMNIQKN